MKIPPNMTEAEVIEVVNNVVGRLCHKFKYGYHEPDDIKQMGWVFAIQGLEKYDNSRPLINFLYTHVKNRLFNFKRDNFERPNKPCVSCPKSAYCKQSDSCTIYENEMDCHWYKGWKDRNEVKRNLMNFIDVDSTKKDHEKRMMLADTASDDVILDEVITIIDSNLNDTELRKNWLKMKAGVSIPCNLKTRVLDKINNILEEYSIDV